MNFYQKDIEDGVFRPLKEEPISLIIEEIDLDDAICYKTQDYCKNNSLTKSEQLLLYDFGDYLMEYLFDKLKEGYEHHLSELQGQNEILTKENDKLKQQMQRLYNYFADWFDDIVPPCDFSEMWDCVKEDEQWD